MTIYNNNTECSIKSAGWFFFQYNQKRCFYVRYKFPVIFSLYIILKVIVKHSTLEFTLVQFLPSFNVHSYHFSTKSFSIIILGNFVILLISTTSSKNLVTDDWCTSISLASWLENYLEHLRVLFLLHFIADTATLYSFSFQTAATYFATNKSTKNSIFTSQTFRKVQLPSGKIVLPICCWVKLSVYLSSNSYLLFLGVIGK